MRAFHTSKQDSRILTTNRITRRSDAHRIAAHGPVQPTEPSPWHFKHMLACIVIAAVGALMIGGL